MIQRVCIAMLVIATVASNSHVSIVANAEPTTQEQLQAKLIANAMRAAASEEWDKEELEETSKEKIAIPEESKTLEKEDVAPETKIDEKKDEPPVSKDVKDRLADLKSEFKKTKKRSAKLGVRDKKR